MVLEMMVENLTTVKVANLKLKKMYFAAKCCQLHRELTVPNQTVYIALTTEHSPCLPIDCICQATRSSLSYSSKILLYSVKGIHYVSRLYLL